MVRDVATDKGGDGWPESRFEIPTIDAWTELADSTLKNTALDRLTVRHRSGVDIAPLFTADDIDVSVDPSGFPGLAPMVRGSRATGAAVGGWDIRARHRLEHGGSVAPLNSAILADLGRSASSIWLELALPVDEAELAAVLDGVLLDLAAVVLDPGPAFAAPAAALAALWASAGVPPSAALGGFGADPLGSEARHGRGGDPIAAAVELAKRVGPSHPGVRVMTVDASVYADAGGTDTQELGAALATGVAYLRALTDSGLDIDQAGEQLSFVLSVDSDQFASIAKLRAARLTWQRIMSASSGSTPAHLHAVAAAAMQARRDPHVNIIRSTIACFAAAIGGADAITVPGHVPGGDDAFTRRIAGNTQNILAEETQVGRVVDPAGGSWYVERLTRDLAAAAWSQFQEIESRGGMIAVLESGWWADQIGEAAAAKRHSISTRRTPIIGVSEFANLEDAIGPHPRSPKRSAFPMRRNSEAFERLRDAVDDWIAESGAERPAVYLATLGPPAEHSARATFATNLFGAGGLQTTSATDHEDPASGLATSGARIACICSSDARYESDAAAAARALRVAGCELVFLAGRPGQHETAWRDAGVDHFIHIGVDVLDALGAAHDVLGIAPSEAPS